MMKKYNILLITTDQQRKDSMHCYNEKVNTPELDSLAQDGIIFDRSYITHPTCTPSRASILTGQLASKHGAYTIGTALESEEMSVAKILKENGYETYLIGKPHFQQLSTKGSYEFYEDGWNEELWKSRNGSYYGFTHCQIYNGHTKYPLTAGMHYRLWLREKGLTTEQIEERFNYKSSDEWREHGTWKMEREYHPSVFTSEMTLKYLDEYKNDKPFMMWVSFSDPHDPYCVPAPYDTMYDPKDVNYLPYKEGEHDNRPECYNQLYFKGVKGMPCNDRCGVPSAESVYRTCDDNYCREITADQYGMMKLVDEEIGRILDKLKEKGLYDDTLIIFTTDHGDYLGNHGYLYKGFPAFEEVYNVPLIIKNPNQKNAGIRSDALISHIDLAPTMLEFAEVKTPQDMDGISEKEVLLAEKETIRDSVIIENRPVQKDFYQKMIVTDQYKMVVYMDSTDGELYDLKKDINQYDNLWSREEYKEIKNTLIYEIYFQYAEKEEVKKGQSSEFYLKEISKQMHQEEPVQERTSYS